MRELDARANQLAHHLRGLGVGPEVIVGLCVERSLEMLVGLIGILKAGGAYLPLDPAYPQERLAFMLDDAGAPLLITQAALRERIPRHDADLIRLDADWPAIARNPTTAPANRLHPNNPAYVIYTSGSTGTPKGVAVTHQNVVRLFSADADTCSTLARTTSGRCSIPLRSTSRSGRCWGHLLHGGRLVVVPYSISRSPSEFCDFVVARERDRSQPTPSAFYQLMQMDPDSPIATRLHCVRNLRR